jgi:hypothetical protein
MAQVEEHCLASPEFKAQNSQEKKKKKKKEAEKYVYCF